MGVETKFFEIKTKGNADILDITKKVGKTVKDAKIKNGIACVFVPGSTAGVTTIEYEPGLLKDLPEAFERVAPQNIEYAHHQTWGDYNGHAHVRSALLKTSFVVPFVNSELVLGTWQQIVLIDFDTRSRERKVLVQIIGD